jgi:hypothetical protein
MFYFDAINNYPPFPIDVVYTWSGYEMSDDIRLSNNNELKYSLRSIDLYAPWVNKIYILTNPPKKYPSWIKDYKKIIVVDHTETFPDAKYLPNTNSNAIETTIVNIKGLSEHYIYFNDDFFIGKKIKYTEFFTPDGKALVDKYTMEERQILKEPKYNVLNIEYPLMGHRMHKHVPIPQIKSDIFEFNEKYAEYIHWIRMTKTRFMRGFDICETYGLNTPCQQIHYPIEKYMYSKGHAILKDNDDKSKVKYIENSSKNLSKDLNEVIINTPQIFCINDTELDYSKREKVQNEMLNFFNTYYPNKASFEI